MQPHTKKILIGLGVMSLLWMFFLGQRESEMISPVPEPTPIVTQSPEPTAEPTQEPATPSARRAGDDYGDEAEAKIKAEFVKSCSAGSNEIACSCMYDYVRSVKSIEQIIEIGNDTESRESQMLFMQAAIICEEDL